MHKRKNGKLYRYSEAYDRWIVVGEDKQPEEKKEEKEPNPTEDYDRAMGVL